MQLCIDVHMSFPIGHTNESYCCVSMCDRSKSVFILWSHCYCLRFFFSFFILISLFNFSFVSFLFIRTCFRCQHYFDTCFFFVPIRFVCGLFYVLCSDAFCHGIELFEGELKWLANDSINWHSHNPLKFISHESQSLSSNFVFFSLSSHSFHVTSNKLRITRTSRFELVFQKSQKMVNVFLNLIFFLSDFFFFLSIPSKYK